MPKIKTVDGFTILKEGGPPPRGYKKAAFRNLVEHMDIGDSVILDADYTGPEDNVCHRFRAAVKAEAQRTKSNISVVIRRLSKKHGSEHPQQFQAWMVAADDQ